jgi:hypothetical protein
LEQRKQHADELRVELGDLFGQVLVCVLLGLAMQPDDLRPIEEIELAEVVRPSIDLGDVTDMRPLGRSAPLADRCRNSP